MFWGISLEVGKRYSQTVEKSFHISMAALTASNLGKGPVTVMVEVDKACYPLCTLQSGKIPQQALDYIFTEGEEVLFYVDGDLDVHLTGYLIDEPSPIEYPSDDEESESDSQSGNTQDDHDKLKVKRHSDSESSEEETLETLITELDGLNEDNDNNVDIWLQRSSRKKRRGENLDGSSAMPVSSLTGSLLGNGNGENDESDDQEWVPGEKRKLSKRQKEKKRCKKQKRKESKHDDQETKKFDKKIFNPNKLDSSNSKVEIHERRSFPSSEAEKTTGCVDKDKDETGNCCGDQEKDRGVKRVLSGEMIVEELVIGQGKKAKKGKQVSVYYEGFLNKSMKEFDSCLKGKPFPFKLGHGEVIKGWDIGVEGMHVGGKRRLTIPPSLGYGSQQIAGIPPNSTLVFVVQLMKVH